MIRFTLVIIMVVYDDLVGCDWSCFRKDFFMPDVSKQWMDVFLCSYSQDLNQFLIRMGHYWCGIWCRSSYFLWKFGV